MSSRFADPASMRARSTIYYDESPKWPPPSPSTKAPPPCTDKSSCKRPVIDMEVFEQIRELDEPDDEEFSRSMVEDYLKQAQSIIKTMDESFANRDLTQLSKDGHFLKGSSAALGVVHVQEICEKIQHLGNRIDRDREPEVKISAEDALARIKPLLARLNDEHVEAKKYLMILIGAPISDHDH